MNEELKSPDKAAYYLESMALCNADNDLDAAQLETWGLLAELWLKYRPCLAIEMQEALEIEILWQAKHAWEDYEFIEREAVKITKVIVSR